MKAIGKADRDMEEKDVIKKLEEARLPEIDTPKGKLSLKMALLEKAARKKPFWDVFIKRYVPSAVLAFAVAVMTVYVVDNMDSGSKFNRQGGMWSTYSDAQEGGDSTVWPPAPTKSGNGFIMSSPGFGYAKYAVHVTGRTGSKFGLNYNYLGFLVRFSAETECPVCKGVDISKYTGIRFKIKGSLPSGKLSFILPYESGECDRVNVTCKSLTEYADYEKDITPLVTGNWATVTIDFRNALKQPSWTPAKNLINIEKVLQNVHLFKWQYENGNGSLADIWLAQVELY
jgi:hypothetical protein